MPAMSGASALRIDSSLRRRTLTALALGPAVLTACLLLPSAAFAAFLGGVFMLAAWEWPALSGYDDRTVRWAFVAALALGMLSLWMLADARWWLVAVAVVWWFGQTLRLCRIDEIARQPGRQPRLLAIGLLVLLAPWAGAVELHSSGPNGPLLIVFLVLLVWTADSLAYFVGRRFGRRKLAPALSPGKTREGVYGALAGALVWGLILGVALSLPAAQVLLCALLCALTVSISVVGDLYESLMKRRRGVKDSSQLLPGHGGMLDRIDSLTAAAPLFAAGLHLMGVIG